MTRRSGSAVIWALVSVALLALLIVAMALLAESGKASVPTDGGRLLIYCAAGLRPAIEPAAKRYGQQFHVEVQLQYGGSADLLGKLIATDAGDLLISADSKTVKDGLKKDALRESIPFVVQHPVLAVSTGNPKGVTGLDDLKPGLRYAIVAPGAAIGATIERELRKLGRWETISANATTTVPTVVEAANAVKVGSVDAAFAWDSTVAVHGLTAVPLAELATITEPALVAVARATVQPRQALHFARWLAAAEGGQLELASAGYLGQAGDAWSNVPKLTMFNGTVNRPAIEQSLREFEKREGCEITTVYNGCGILCSEIDALAKQGAAKIPDIYIACDICFVPQVAKYFPEAVVATETDLVIAVPKGNPKGITRLTDLAKPGLKLGMSNHLQSSLGLLSKRLVDETGQGPAIMANAVNQATTADMLMAGLDVGKLDAAIVYSVTVKPRAATVDAVAIPGAKAVQPYAISVASQHQQLAGRLLDYLLSHRERYELAGFKMKDRKNMPSATADDNATRATLGAPAKP